MSTIEALRDPAASMAHVMRAVAELESDAGEPTLRAGVSANVTTDLFGTYLRKHALLGGGSAEVEQGSYDSHLENVQRFASAGVDQLVLINFFDNLMPAFEARLTDLDPALVEAQRQRVAQELQLALEDARGIKAVFVTLFHRFSAPAPSARSAAIDAAVAAFNEAVEDVVAGFPNAATISTADAVAAVGRDEALSPRFYLRAKAPYTHRFWDELARRVSLASRSAGSYLLKALVLDCDNTLWGGVVGEDLIDGIALGPDSYPGNVFWRVQNELLALQRRGVLLCLATKNNPDDVDEVLRSHPHQMIRDEHLIVKKVNWDDKVANIEAIAEELGIGLDSIAFLDDSPFELESVRERLPQVHSFAVPRNVFEYPDAVQSLGDRFLCGRPDDGGADKTEQYRIRARAKAESSRFATREEYLASLGLEVELRRDPRDAIGRIAELTQKSNQFNLTTRRYTEAEIADLVESPDAAVYTLGVSDRFGDSGITGVAIVRYVGAFAQLDSFLMSCRVLGRGVELAPWQAIAGDASAHGCRQFVAEWIRSQRNAQVEDFLDRLGLELLEATPDRRAYRASLDGLVFTPQPHISLNHDR
jgi:FkbH-like protein